MASIRDAAVGLFLEEAAEHFAVLEEGLLALERDPSQTAETVDRLFRAAHTLKGSAALMKLETVSVLSHRLEDALEMVRDEGVTPGRERIDAFLFTLDRIRDAVRLAKEGKSAPGEMVAEVEERLQGSENPVAPGSETMPPPPAPQAVKGAFVGPERRDARPEKDDLAGVVRVGSEKIEAMMNVLGQLTVTQTHLVNQLATVEEMRKEIGFSGERLMREVNRFAERYAYALPEQIRTAGGAAADFQELEFDRYDEINLFARKLQEITNDISEALGTTGAFFNDFTGEIEAMDRMVREMKERISEARTVQAGLLFQRFTRTLRDLSRQSGKELEFNVAGGETLIDRALYDGLYDPLLHILRNAVGHGIESPEERIARGKPAAGTIWLSASRQGNTVHIEVRDDGRGVQLEEVRRRGVEKGLLTPDARPSERELYQLLFAPGFSTTEAVDSISGRGVGMNVVMDRLAALNGTIDIQSWPGEGTIMRLALPLSLIIVNVIQFRLGTQSFVIPSTLVEEIANLPAAGQAPREVTVREGSYATVDLHGLFGIPREESPRFAIVTRSSGDPAALLVDAILSQEDTVIRPFDSLLREMPHFAGTSVAGDGTLRLVLNPARLSGAARAAGDLAPPPDKTLPAATSAADSPLVLVVDDSLSVRKYASMMLEAKGVRVRTATNGMEALEMIESEDFHFVISDLEMPVMHGYELLSELGRRGVLERVPVAILSSRAGAQHREKALGLGACDYLVKPFEEETLLAAIRRHARWRTDA